MNLAEHKAQAQQDEKQFRQFLKKLKQKKPKDLDVVVQEKHEEVFEEIDCLSCANCCKTTGPLFTERDIERIAKKLKLRPGQFIDKYLRKDEDNDWVLQALPCPFLGSDNYCSIYAFRPQACAEYPHTDRRKIYQINSIMEKNIPICPAAHRFVQKLQGHYEKGF